MATAPASAAARASPPSLPSWCASGTSGWRCARTACARRLRADLTERSGPEVAVERSGAASLGDLTILLATLQELALAHRRP